MKKFWHWKIPDFKKENSQKKNILSVGFFKPGPEQLGKVSRGARCCNIGESN
jgi:hypothetical protein